MKKNNFSAPKVKFKYDDIVLNNSEFSLKSLIILNNLVIFNNLLSLVNLMIAKCVD